MLATFYISILARIVVNIIMQTLALTIQTWYTEVSKPYWAPPVWLFDIAWAIIYPLMALSFGYVFWMSFFKREWHWGIGLLFVLNLVLNLVYAIGIYTVFGSVQQVADVQTYYWPAAYIVAATLVTLIPMILLTWKRARWVAICQLPYIVWIIIATLLQFAIAMFN